MNKRLHILYTILNWGLGHATRSVPLIKELMNQGVQVSLAGEGDSLLLLKSEFPQLNFYEVHGIKVNYPARLPMALAMMKQSFHIRRAIRREHRQILDLVKEIRPDAIISDNRYGAWVKDIPSVIICHQLQLKTPAFLRFAEPALFTFHKRYLLHFSEIWVPDHESEQNITAGLSHSVRALKELKPVFIGPLSRLKDVVVADIQERYDILAILSGPEPQRSRLELELVQKLSGLPYSVLLVRGKPAENKIHKNGNILTVPSLPPGELSYHFKHSRYIICRAGHSTLMDLCAFQRTAIAIPTPGQTEQEYLAEKLSAMKHIVTFQQGRLSIEEGIQKLRECSPLNLPVNDLLSHSVKVFIEKLSK